MRNENETVKWSVLSGHGALAHGFLALSEMPSRGTDRLISGIANTCEAVAGSITTVRFPLSVNAPPLQVQVIGQQWAFTYRFPGYGGVETQHLELPAHRLIAFHVTSLDVIHSFWAYQLGVKADANPGVDNIAYVETRKPLSFDIHCVELCGVWHGYMYDTGRVVSGAEFASWIAGQQRTFAPATKQLDPYSKTYFPDPQRRGG